jgi:hypothetical protein
MAAAKYPGCEALNPFFEIAQKGLAGLVDGDHFFEAVAEDALFDFRYRFPGWPPPAVPDRTTATGAPIAPVRSSWAVSGPEAVPASRAGHCAARSILAGCGSIRCLRRQRLLGERHPEHLVDPPHGLMSSYTVRSGRPKSALFRE